MSHRMPRTTADKLIAALKRGGWVVVRQTRHTQMRHPERGRLVSIPRHAGETLDPKLLGWILEQADLTAEELKELL